MSQANIPNITPNITLTRDDAINLLLSSIALEEIGLSHILNAEGEKIQFALGTLPGITGPGPTLTLADVIAVNQTVQSTLDTIMKKELLLDSKLKKVTELIESTPKRTILCEPIQQPCDGTTVTLFSAGNMTHYSGVVIITNTSLDCMMAITVTDVNGTSPPYLINPQSEHLISVNQVTAIQNSCSCFAGQCPDQICLGAFEANLLVT